MSVSKPKIVQSTVFNALLRTSWMHESGLPMRIWDRAWQASRKRFNGPVKARVHGRTLLLNYRHPYPFYARFFPALNSPLLEVVHQAAVAKNAPATVVDVGANVGDSEALIDANCPGDVGCYLCVEGDPAYFEYLNANLGKDQRAILRRVMLSSHAGTERALVQSLGTASAEGDSSVPAQPLDDVIEQAGIPAVDVIKVDVDGFDGKVLQGATRTLHAQHPAVIFEWHPIFIQRTGNDLMAPFNALAQAGYDRFVWYTKMGQFSHFTGADELRGVALLAELCLAEHAAYPDWHYDVIALHPDSPLSHLQLAELPHASARVSPY